MEDLGKISEIIKASLGENRFGLMNTVAFIYGQEFPNITSISKPNKGFREIVRSFPKLHAIEL